MINIVIEIFIVNYWVMNELLSLTWFIESPI